MDDGRLDIFLSTLSPPLSPALEQFHDEAASGEVPVVGYGAIRLLRVLLELKKPQRILEIGTAVGFSSVLFCTYSDACVVTIENYSPRIDRAKEHIAFSGFEDRIRLLEGNAEDILPELNGTYDLVFLDAAQGQYISYLPELLRLLADGGVLVTDNVLKGGTVLDSRYAVERRNRTIHKRLREYLEALCSAPELVTTVLPVDDGVAVSVKRRCWESS